MTDHPQGDGVGRRALWILLVLPALLYLIVTFIGPLLLVIRESVMSPHLTLENYARALNIPAYRKILWITIRISLETTVICLLLGYPLSFVMANTRKRMAVFLMGMVLLPFWISGLIRSYAWVVLLRDTGLVNSVLVGLRIVREPLRLVYNEFGVLVGMAYVLLPFMVLTIYSVLVRIDTDLVPAAYSLGANGSQAFRWVYFPLSVPGVSAGALLVFIQAVGFYVTPALLGGSGTLMMAMVIEIMINQVADWAFGSALTVILLVAVISGVLLGLRVLDTEALGLPRRRKGVRIKRRDSQPEVGGTSVQEWADLGVQAKGAPDLVAVEALKSQPIGAVGSTPRYRAPRTRWGWIGGCIVAFCVCAYLILPVLLVAAMSLDPSSLFRFPPRTISLHWYRHYFTVPLWVQSTVLSLQVAVAVTVLATVLGSAAAMGLHRGQFRGRTVITAVLLSPMIVPVIVTGLALYILALKVRMVGTFSALVLGHTVLAIPPVMVLVGASLRRFDERLEHAALTLGATRWYAWRRVLVPSILPGLVSGGLFAFLTSFDEVVIAIFLAGTFTPTLPKRIWDSVRLDIDPTISAVATLLVIVAGIVTLVAAMLQRKKRAGA
jgi:putative spermidine/putrescine transport system permease protein